MLFTIQDQTRQSWQVDVEFKTREWKATGGVVAGSPLSFFSAGKVVSEPDGSLRLVTAFWDLNLLDAPRSPHDRTRPSGSVSFDNLRAGAWDRGPLRWFAGSGPEPLKDSPRLPKRTGDLRVDIVNAVRAVMPCFLGDDNWEVIEPGAKSDISKKTYDKRGTSCYKLPGFITQYAGAAPHGLAFRGNRRIEAAKEYMDKRSLNGTNIVRDRGIKEGAWVKADGLRLPQPGDVYALLDRDKKGVALTDRDRDGIGHVGVVLKATQTSWETADLGQGTGWEGNITHREYHAGVGELFGQANHPGLTKFRIVAGWVDVERYFPEYSRQLKG